jgi:hypothetical protein
MTNPDSNGQNLPREPPVVGDEIETPATRLSRTTMNVGGVHDAHTVEAGPPTGHKRRHRGVPGVQPVIARRRSASMNTPGSASSKLVIQHDIGSDVGYWMARRSQHALRMMLAASSVNTMIVNSTADRGCCPLSDGGTHRRPHTPSGRSGARRALSERLPVRRHDDPAAGLSPADASPERGR